MRKKLQFKEYCKYCGKEFITVPSKNAKFCSTRCFNLSRIGHPISELTRIRTAESNRNRIWKESSRNKVSNTLKKLGIKPPSRKGIHGKRKDNPITPENKRIRQSIEYSLWRESVFARDNWVCQKCGERGGILNPHHIKNFSQYPELRFVIDNGITLCKECHIEFHHLYGHKNNTIEQIKEFLSNPIK